MNGPAFGLHVKSRFDKIVDINDCHINGKFANEIFQFISKTYMNIILLLLI